MSARAGGDRRGRLLLIAATATWTAYNDWGGSNHYQGYCGPDGDRFSPVLSLERPLAKGFVSLPPDAPRAVLMDDPAHHVGAALPAHGMGLCQWLFQEIHVLRLGQLRAPLRGWAEAEGYTLDIISQTDLHYRPELLDGYACVVLVGHDEYWSWEMRDAVDAYVVQGGRIARFAGNFMWQIRLEDEGRTQVCYKYIARDEDPLMRRARATSSANHGRRARSAGPGPQVSASTPRMVFMPAGPAARRAAPRASPSTGPSTGPSPGPASITATCWAPPRASSAMRWTACLTRSAAACPIQPIPSQAPEGLQILALGLSATVEEGPTILPGRSFLGIEDGEYVASVSPAATTRRPSRPRSAAAA